MLVIGFDGATWTVIDELLERGELPHLAALRQRALHGVLETRVPGSSPLIWTTIFTGKLKEEHGIDSFPVARSKSRQVRALWDIVSAAG